MLKLRQTAIEQLAIAGRDPLWQTEQTGQTGAKVTLELGKHGCGNFF